MNLFPAKITTVQGSTYYSCSEIEKCLFPTRYQSISINPFPAMVLPQAQALAGH
jgi:hypothetical protein